MGLTNNILDNEGLLFELVNHTNNAIIITDLEGGIVYTNSGFTAITGYDQKEVLGKKPGTFLQGPETSPHTIQSISEKLRNLQRVNERVLNYHKDGSTYWLQLDIYPIFDNDSKPTHYMAVESVITDLKFDEEIMHQQESNLKENIAYAQKLQDALFRKEIKKDILKDYFIVDLPKDRVGGDFYILDEIQGKKVIFLGDCTGHGASGAMLTAMCVSIIKELLRKYKTLSPAMIIQKSQLKLEELLSDGKNSISDNMEATLIFINEVKKELTYATTVQELYYLGDENQQLLKGNRLKPDEEIPVEKFNYEPGSMIYLASDGLKDQFGGPSDKKFTKRKIFDLVSNNYKKDMTAQKQTFVENIAEWKGGKAHQTDDILLIGIRLN